MFDTKNTTLFQDVSAGELRFEELTEQFLQAHPDSEATDTIWQRLCDVADAIREETQG